MAAFGYFLRHLLLPNSLSALVTVLSPRSHPPAHSYAPEHDQAVSVQMSAFTIILHHSPQAAIYAYISIYLYLIKMSQE